MATARYWRIYVTKSQHIIDLGGTDPYLFLYEVEMRGTVGGTDLCVGGTASASSSTGNNLPNLAFANDGSATGWYLSTGGTMPAWLKYDFGVGNAVSVAEVAIMCAAEVAPESFSIQYSNNNIDWNILYDIAGATWVGEDPSWGYFSASNVHRYWRLYVTSTNHSSGSMILSEAEFRAVEGGADKCTIANTGASSCYPSGHQYASIFDNDTVTQWYMTGNPGWFAYDFNFGNAGQSVFINEVALRFKDATQTPKDFSLQWSDNGVDWNVQQRWQDITAWTVNTLTLLNSSNAWDTNMATLTPVPINKIGIVNLDNILVAASVGGDTVAASSGLIFVLKNSSNASVTMTLVRPADTTQSASYGKLALASVTLVVAAGKIGMVTIPPGYASSGNFLFTYSASTTVSVGVIYSAT